MLFICLQDCIAVDLALPDSPLLDNRAAAFPTSERVADDPSQHSRESKCRFCLRGRGVDDLRIAARLLPMKWAASGSACPAAHDRNLLQPVARWPAVCAAYLPVVPPRLL